MTERYVKSGRTLRIEMDSRGKTNIQIAESGVAVLEDQQFHCSPAEDGRDVPPPPPHMLEQLVKGVEALVRPPLSIERLIAIAGTSEHLFTSGDETNRWSDGAARLHVSVAHRSLNVRILLDLGSSDPLELEAAALAPAFNALAAAEGARTRMRCSHLRLGPAVSAALWPLLLTQREVAAETRLAFEQRATPIVPFDGKGRTIAETPLAPFASTEWPNFFRPSYRVRPLRTPMNVDVRVPNDMAPGNSFEGLALLSPCRASDNSLKVDVLCRDPDGRSFPATLVMTAREWCASIAGTGGESRWYPFGSGSFGRETLLRDVDLMPWGGL